MKPLYVIGLCAIAGLLAGCAPARDVASNTKDVAPLRSYLISENASVYMTCWNGLVFVHVYNGGITQVFDAAGLPYACPQQLKQP